MKGRVLIMANLMEKIENFQANNRAKRQVLIDEEISYVQGFDIMNAAAAMIEAEVNREKIKELLIKYWDLRPSDADSFIQRALEEYF